MINHIFVRTASGKLLLVRLVTAFLLLLWILGFSLLSLTGDSFFGKIGAFFLNPFFGTLCHQQPHKLPILFGHHLMVCFRCTGIYSGALAAALTALFISFPVYKKLLLFPSAFLILDVLLHSAGIYSYSPALAFFTGFLFGSVLFIYILPSLELFFVRKQ